MGVLFTKERVHAQAAMSRQAKLESGRRIVVYYLYDSFRCDSCRKIEAYTQEAVQKGFSSDMPVEWKPLNTDKPENAHFLKDYKLISKSVVVAEFDDQKQKRWKELDKIWDLLKDKAAFKKYIRNEVEGYLPK
jgi:hypothetical protein